MFNYKISHYFIFLGFYFLVGDSYAQLWFEGHKENCNIKMQNTNYKGECVL